MPSLSHQKEKLERQKAKLQSQEQKLKELERRKRTRRLIELGGLIVKAEPESLNNNTLLGALLSLKDIASNAEILAKWTDAGAEAFATMQAATTDTDKADKEDKIALLITFTAEPPREIKSQLRDLNFKWNPFRKEWYGYGDRKDLLRLIKPFGGNVELCG